MFQQQCLHYLQSKQPKDGQCKFKYQSDFMYIELTLLIPGFQKCSNFQYLFHTQGSSSINGCNLRRSSANPIISCRNVDILCRIFHCVSVLLCEYFRGFDYYHLSRAGWIRIGRSRNWQKSGYMNMNISSYPYTIVLLYNGNNLCWSNSLFLPDRNRVWILPSMLHLWNVTCQKNELVSNIGFGGLLSRHRSSTSSWP